MSSCSLIYLLCAGPGAKPCRGAHGAGRATLVEHPAAGLDSGSEPCILRAATLAARGAGGRAISAQRRHGSELSDCVAQALLRALGCGRGAGTPAASPEAEEAEPAAAAGGLFDGAAPPEQPLAAYVARLHSGFQCSDSTLVCAIVLLDRLLARGQQLRSDGGRLELTLWNVHRLFLACAVLSAKYNEDLTWTNKVFARVGGIHRDELNRAEEFVFSRLDFNLCVSQDEFELYWDRLSALAAATAPPPRDPFTRPPQAAEGPAVGRLARRPAAVTCGGAVCGLLALLRLGPRRSCGATAGGLKAAHAFEQRGDCV